MLLWDACCSCNTNGNSKKKQQITHKIRTKKNHVAYERVKCSRRLFFYFHERASTKMDESTTNILEKVHCTNRHLSVIRKFETSLHRQFKLFVANDTVEQRSCGVGWNSKKKTISRKRMMIHPNELRTKDQAIAEKFDLIYNPSTTRYFNLISSQRIMLKPSG